MSDKPRRCEFCRHYRMVREECWRYPPVLVPAQPALTFGRIPAHWDRPKVKDDDTCGEFEERWHTQ